MGFDLYMNITANCSLISFINHCKKLELDFLHSFPDYQINDLKFENWMMTNPKFDVHDFLDSIEISYVRENFTVGICDWGHLFESEDEDETGFHIINYSDLLLIDIITKALENNDDDIITKFCKLFDDIEELSISKDDRKITFTLLYVSSYKGRESIDLDFKSLNKEILDLEELFGDINVKASIGLD